jgi:phage shock protein C
MNRTMTLDLDNAMLGGVCSGLTEYFNINVTFIRLMFIFVFAFTSGAIVILYITLWFIIPQKDKGMGKDHSTVDFASQVRKKSLQTTDLARRNWQNRAQLIGIGLVILGVIIFLQVLDLSLLHWIQIITWPAFLLIFGIILTIRALKGWEK